MNLVSCKRCKKLFNSVHSQSLCSSCEQELDKLFLVVKDFLFENPSASLSMISSKTGASTALITRFIREGKLVLSKDSPIELSCTKCGKPITSGKLCAMCNQKVLDSIETISQTCISENLNNSQSAGSRMRSFRK